MGLLGWIIAIILIIGIGFMTFKKWFLPLWLGYERLFIKVFHLKTLDSDNPFFHYRIRPFKGRPIPMANGDELRKGDLIAELHFDNERLYHMGSESRSYVHLAIQLIRLAQKQLPKMTEILKNPEFSNVKAIYGISMVHRGVKQLGFQVTEMPRGVLYLLTRLYLRLLVSVIHPNGRDRLKENTEELIPKIIIHPSQDAFIVKKKDMMTSDSGNVIA
jgi:peptidoglycan-N-acetylglucosamine deacetylase